MEYKNIIFEKKRRHRLRHYESPEGSERSEYRGSYGTG